MQDTSLSLPLWVFAALRDIAMVLSGGLFVKLITLYQNRRKPFVEVKKTEAETTEITIRSHATAGDSMIRMMDRLDEALENIDRLRAERDEWKFRAEQAEFRAEQAETQQKIDEHYVGQLLAANKLGLKLSDMQPARIEDMET